MRTKFILMFIIIVNLTFTGCRPGTRYVGTIAFTASGNGSGNEIYTILSDGNNETLITQHSFQQKIESFSVSPNGMQITYDLYFPRTMPGPYTEIMTINVDGSGETRLTDNEYNDENPSWSPDGSLILFESSRDKTSRENYIIRHIFVMNADGSNEIQLTGDYDSDDWDPTWSPDGEKIAFTSDRDGVSEIYVMKSDGSGQTRLTYEGGFQPIWSPDGQKIAFRRGSLNPDIYVINIDGSNEIQITNTLGGDQIMWSPDNLQIVFVRDREIFIINADGSGEKQLTDAANESRNPVWSPDGLQIAFLSNRDNYQWDIYTMNSNGNQQTKITNDIWVESSLIWTSSVAVYLTP